MQIITQETVERKRDNFGSFLFDKCLYNKDAIMIIGKFPPTQGDLIFCWKARNLSEVSHRISPISDNRCSNIWRASITTLSFNMNPKFLSSARREITVSAEGQVQSEAGVGGKSMRR